MLLILVLIVLTLIIYFYIIKTWSYFSDQKVPFERGFPFLGWLSRIIFKQSSFGDEMCRIYNEHPNDKFVGLYDMGGKPTIMIRDPELMKTICIKEFDSFVNHNFSVNTDLDPILGRALFFMKDQTWRDMRSILSPLFTGSKMRNMMRLMDEASVDFVKTLSEKVKQTSEFNVENLLKSLTCDVILSCAFGIKKNSLKDPNNEFYEAGLALAYAVQSPKILITSSLPTLSKIFRIQAIEEKYNHFFRESVRLNIIQREEKNIVRNDMIHLLMQAKRGMLKINEGEEQVKDIGFATILVAEEISNRSIEKLRELSDDDFVAQCMVFFMAGFTGIAITNALMLYELARNPDVQERLLREIEDTKEELNGKEITFEVIQRMKYLDQVISEAMRLWPVGAALDRKVNKPFVAENSDGTRFAFIPGDILWFPVIAMHRDEKYFPEPEKFDPERFSDENKHKITAYAPFGLGPRSCVASRFALMALKALAFRLVESFEFECGPKTDIPLKFKKGSSAMEFENGVWLQIKNRK